MLFVDTYIYIYTRMYVHHLLLLLLLLFLHLGAVAGAFGESFCPLLPHSHSFPPPSSLVLSSWYMDPLFVVS